MSMVKLASTALRELPSNVGWLASRLRGSGGAVASAAEATTARARGSGRRLGEAVADAVPIGADSIQLRMKRAEDEARHAREAEERAVEAAQEAKERSDHALEVSERGQQRAKDVNRELAAELERRVKQAEVEAEALRRRGRLAAQEEIEKRRTESLAEIEEECRRAQQAAESAQQRAEELVAEADAAMAEAKRLAGEVAEAARFTADRADRHARELARDADQQSREAGARVDLAGDLLERSAATVRRTGDGAEGGVALGRLQSYTKSELLELASTIGISGRTNMSKNELVRAIRKASRVARAGAR